MLDKHYNHFNEPINVGIGDLERFTYKNRIISGKTSQGYFKIAFYNHSIIRFEAHFRSFVSRPSYAVIANPKPISVDFQNLPTEIICKTKNLKLTIFKKPFRLSFQTRTGQIINEDETGLGLMWTGQAATVYKKLQPDEHFIGLGEKPGDLDRFGTGHTHWNTDYFAYPPEADSIYSSFPFYIGVHNQVQYGILVDNTHKTHFNFGASNNRFTSFGTEQGILNYYFIYDKTVANILKQYAFLTGKMPLPPRWALGYQQSRYSYHSAKRVLDLAKQFRAKQIPADVIYLDIHYMDGYKIFSWDKQNFPDPKTLIKSLENLGFKVAVILNPGIKVEPDYAPYDDGCRKDIFIKYPDGTYYKGQVWPGWCHFPDFTNPKTQNWWTRWFKEYVRLGVKGFWNDMNEIATWGQHLPEMLEFNAGETSNTIQTVRNIYGFLMCKATFKAAKSNLKNRRPFLLTRAAYLGVQRYSAIWTGDNIASNEHLLLGLRQLSSLGLSGVPFAGFDCGGFVGEADANLYARWLSIAVFTPFLRNHTMIDTKDSEPWAFGETVEAIARNYLNFRYRLLPYLYATFYKASKTGLPIMRSLAINYTHDQHIYSKAYQHQYLFGPAFLIAPVESEQNFTEVYLPAGNWYDLYNDAVFEGGKTYLVKAPLERLPIFVKAGAIIPLQSLRQSTAEQPADTLSLHLYRGSEDNIFTYYEDDGHSYDYKKKCYYKRTIEYFAQTNELLFNNRKGYFKSIFTKVKLILHGFEPLKQATVDDTVIMVEQARNYFFEPLPNFDPLGKSYSNEGSPVQTLTFKFDNQITLVKFGR